MKKESIFDNKTFLVVLSVVMAFLAWIFVSLNSNDTKGKTISGIAIDMQQVDESIGKLGLSTISAEQPKVTVRVEGVIYDIGNLTASDVRVYPDISKVNHRRRTHGGAQRRGGGRRQEYQHRVHLTGQHQTNLTAWKPLPWTSKQGCPGTAHRQTII